MVRIVLFLSTGTFLISPSETTSCSVLLLFDLTQALLKELDPASSFKYQINPV